MSQRVRASWQPTSLRPLSRAALLALIAVSLATCMAGEDSRSSILLVTWDTVRADRLGAYGSQSELTPNADRLAAQAVVYERCIAPIGTTIPSHSTMFTGLYPASHRVRRNSQSLPPGLPVVTEALRDAGYATGAFVALKLMLTHAGLDRGFDRLTDQPGTKVGRALRRRDERVLELALEWLESVEAAQPFFGWVHFYAPHTPLISTPYSTKRLAGRPDARARVSVEEFYEGAWIGDVSATERIHALYDGEVQATDARLGRLLDALERIGRADSTVVILTADHGQALGDNGYHGHGNALWNSILRVPLVIRAPGVPGRRISDRVGLVDLAPTILQLAGVAALSELDGRSLVPSLHGEKIPERLYFAETQSDLEQPAGAPRFRTHHRVAVFSGPHKLLRTDLQEVLFDLETDPGEIDPNLEIPAELRARLGEPAARYEHSTTTGRNSEVAEDVAEALKALGYTE